MIIINEIITYKCPSCGGELLFNPEKQNFLCEYCHSQYSTQSLSNPKAPDMENEIGGYTCPSCGAEVITDSTLGATICFYCHNPVTISSRFIGDFRPDKIIPFKIDRKQALSKFLEWVGKKKYVPPEFFAQDQLDKITGVYFPYWVIDADIAGQINAKGQKVRTWKAGDTRYTEISHYNILREGSVHFEDLVKTALKKANKQLVESVQPFDDTAMEKFSYSYFSGFQAEKRDIEAAEIKDNAESELNNLASKIFKNTVQGFSSVSNNTPRLAVTNTNWDYCLMPVWVLTYKSPNDHKLYYYALNGQTGKINGELPVDKKRLLKKSLLWGGIAFIMAAILTGAGVFI